MSRASTRSVASDQVDAVVAASRALIGVAVLSLSELGDRITLVQFRALVILTDCAPLKSSDLADRLGVSASSVTRICDRLVAEGLLRRLANPDSRREVLLSASARGIALVNKVMGRRHRDLEHILTAMTPSQRDQLVTALDVFTAHAENLHGPVVLAEWPT